ncbi:MAG: hypothetical protein ACM3N3_11240 [Betaproteobacteria bacterium]|jgi:hypothetical protein
MAHLTKHFDAGSLLVILITFFLFVAALFTKGFTHDLLLEAGVFLVSVKLIIMSYKHGVTADNLLDRLNQMHATLERLEHRIEPSGRGRP